MNLIKLKKQKKRQTEKIYIIEQMNIHIIFRIFEQKTHCNGTITLKEAHKDQSNLLVEILNSKKQVKPKIEKMFLKTYIILLKVEKDFLCF